jgi:hypothetical protein
MTIRLRFPRPRKPTESSTAPFEPIVWQETGGWSVGWHDEAERFPYRAEWLRLEQTRHHPMRVAQ